MMEKAGREGMIAIGSANEAVQLEVPATFWPVPGIPEESTVED